MVRIVRCPQSGPSVEAPLSTTTVQPNSPVGYGELVRRNVNFRWLWCGQIISLLGDWFNLIASASLVAQLSGSGVAIGGLFVVRMLAPFLVSPIAGVVADRYNRKYILILTDITRALTVFCFLFIREASQIWLLYVLTSVQLGISGFFFPTRNAILPDIVLRGELGTANAISSTTWSVMLALGAAIGGLVSGTWGIYPAFSVDALTFFVSALFIARIKYDPPAGIDASEKTVGAALKQYVDGLRYLRNHVDVLVITLHNAANALLISSGFQVLQVAISKNVFVMGQGGGISLGLMFGVAGIGTGIGPILARRFTGDRDSPLRYTIVLSYVIMGLGMLLVAPLLSFPVVLLGILLRGVGGGINWVFSTQLLLQLAPNQVRGRIFATEFAFFTLMSAASAAVVGGVLDASVSISVVAWWMGGLVLIPATLWTLWLVVGTRTEPASEEIDLTVAKSS
jgi:MFS family permease